MKKEKKRELTINQLEKRRNIAKKISNYFIIVAIFLILVLSAISIITGITLPEYVAMKIVSITVIGVCVIYGIILKFAVKYENEIKNKNKQRKISRINQLICNGDIKEEVIIKDEMLKNAILSNNIEKVIFREIKVGAVIPKDADCTIELYLKDGSLLQTIFSMEDFLKLINRASKTRMLNHLIRSIKIENSEVTIDAENFNWKGKVTDDELIEMFELKE